MKPPTAVSRRFSSLLREALIVLVAGAGLSLAYAALTQKGIFQVAPQAPDETEVGMPPAPMMITGDDAEQLFREGAALFVDARSEFDFRLGHIQGAINIPLKSATRDVPLLPDEPPDRLIVTYCDGQNCNSSIDLAARLYASGFENVRIFFGGWEEWQQRGLPREEGTP